MDIVEIIENNLSAKKELERNSGKLSKAVSDEKMSEDAVVEICFYSRQSGEYRGINISFEFLSEALSKQLEKNQAKLDGINKKLEAIGALMGAE